MPFDLKIFHASVREIGHHRVSLEVKEIIAVLWKGGELGSSLSCHFGSVEKSVAKP